MQSNEQCPHVHHQPERDGRWATVEMPVLDLLIYALLACVVVSILVWLPSAVRRGQEGMTSFTTLVKELGVLLATALALLALLSSRGGP
jgi:hypothetical protein